MPNNRNLHRNVFFRDCAHVPPMPFSALDSQHPEDLWQWMDAQRKAGNELLAILHNANVSDGWMYPVDVDTYGRPIDAAYAASRDRNERLVEIKQIKGASETHPLLSPTDEFAGSPRAPQFAWVSFLLMGGLVAADARISARLLAILAAALGCLHGYLNGSGFNRFDDGIDVVLGLALAVFVIVALCASLVIPLRRAWTRVAVRVAGSWIAASGLLLLGWTVHAMR